MPNPFIAAALTLIVLVPSFAAEGADATTRSGDCPANESAELHAGPVRIKFSDGELRYVRVGDEEIIRRIYFAVRDGHWDTVMPTFTRLDLDDQHDHFAIHLAAQCKNDKVDYKWSATITGDTDGKISFAVEGTAHSDFSSNRIGLCVLYGTPQLAGRSFETLASADSPPRKGTFSPEVDPELLASDYRTIRYDTVAGVHVTCAGTGSGLFRMEDQRNYGDSSYKAYFPIDYPYPNVSRGTSIAQSVTITVAGATLAATTQPAVRPTHVRLGNPVAGAKLPRFMALDPTHRSPGFYSLNFNRAKFHDASVLLWNYTPITHLPDDDVALENLPTVIDQARVAHIFAPHASLHVGPITLDPPSPHPDRLPGRPGTFAAAWATAFYGNLARAGISKVAYSVSGPAVNEALKSIEPYVGRLLVATEITPGLPLTDQGTSPIQGFAARGENEDAVWLINLTPKPREVLLNNPTPARRVRVLRLNDDSQSTGGTPEQLVNRLNGPSLTLNPWEICRVVFEN